MPVATVRALPLFSLISPCDGICISHLWQKLLTTSQTLSETSITQWQAFLLVLTDSLSLSAFSQSRALLINNFPCILFHILYMKSLCFIQSRNISGDGLQHRRKKHYGCWVIFFWKIKHTHTQENKYQKSPLVKGIKSYSVTGNLEEIWYLEWMWSILLSNITKYNQEDKNLKEGTFSNILIWFEFFFWFKFPFLFPQVLFSPSKIYSQ